MSPRPLARAARLCCRGGGTRWARLRFHLGADGRVVDRVVTEGEILADGRGKVAARPVQQCVLDVLEVRELEPRQVDRGEMTVLRELDRQDRVGEGVAREDRDTLLEAGGIQDVRLVDDGRPDDRTKTWRTRLASDKRNESTDSPEPAATGADDVSAGAAVLLVSGRVPDKLALPQ